MKRMQGLTMIELLVGLAIGSLVIVGTVFVYSQSRTTYTINETQARLQENARYVFAVLEPDIQLAGNYGFSNSATDLMWGPTKTPAADMEPTDARRGPGAVPTCGDNFALNLFMAIDGSNDDYATGLGCPVAAEAAASVPNMDVLTIRRASTESVPASAARVQIYANRLLKSQQQIFNSATAPGPIDTTREVRDLLFRSYYVGQNSRSRENFPTLWRKSLGSNAAGAAPEVLDEEIMPGVEDFQVQFGIDTGDRNADGVPDADTMEPFGVPDTLNGVVSRWVQPGDILTKPVSAGAGAINAQIVAVRVWLRIRADLPETGFTDTRTYTYAGRPDWTPPAGSELASTRRILVSRTFFVRNARIY
jgi:type IV pilus assembly protein PilW